MEIFRSLGIVRDVRNAGLPADFPNDVAYRVDIAEPESEFLRIPIPCRRDRYASKDGPDTWWPTPEPPHRINQTFLEPVMFSHVSSNPRITVLSRTRAESFHKRDAGIVAKAVNLETNESVEVDGQFLVGCDGARSRIRHLIGAKLHGTAIVERVQSTYIRAPDLLARFGTPFWMAISFNKYRRGTVMAVDGRERWLIHNFLREDEPDFDSVDRDWSLRAILGVGAEFHYETLSVEDWFGRRLVADRFRNGRAFICGDAGHTWAPYAGYGMNAGIADAMDLSWMLAAAIKGWGGDALLDAYEAERLPITQQVSKYAMEQAMKVGQQHRTISSAMQFEGAHNKEAREQFAKQVYDLTVHQYCCGGLNFGYFYEGSPVIAYDGAEHPAYNMHDFTESTVPGCRTPHLWLHDGRSLFDILGQDYTLLCFDPQIDIRPLQSAAACYGVPLEILDLSREAWAPVYDRKLILSRPDGHVAWRGDALPAKPGALINLVRGAMNWKSAKLR
jgi:2-polyprenyl-6-methoxyphenol hydroxylase-like FAD-dependent oxidoreductase